MTIKMLLNLPVDGLESMTDEQPQQTLTTYKQSLGGCIAAFELCNNRFWGIPGDFKEIKDPFTRAETLMKG